MWLSMFEDTLMCKNNTNTLRMLTFLIFLSGLAILITGIIDLSVVTKVCPQQPANSTSVQLATVGAGIWGSPAIIMTGVLSAYLIDHPIYTVKFLQLLALASGIFFAPAVVIISAVDASQLSGVICGSINIQTIAICLSAFGGVAFILIGLLIFRLYCSIPNDDSDGEILVKTSTVDRVYAQKDEFMASTVPVSSIPNNGWANPMPKPCSTNQVVIPYTVVKKPEGGALSVVVPQAAAYNASPQQQLLSLAQVQQSQQRQPGLAGQQNYFVAFPGDDKIFTNMYPQMYKMNG